MARETSRAALRGSARDLDGGASRHLVQVMQFSAKF